MNLINASMSRPVAEAESGVKAHRCTLFCGLVATTFVILALAGCASGPPAPVRVEVPVMVPCIGEVPQRPAYEFDQLTPEATDGEIVLALARDWPRGRRYEGDLRAALLGCQSVTYQPGVL